MIKSLISLLRPLKTKNKPTKNIFKKRTYKKKTKNNAKIKSQPKP